MPEEILLTQEGYDKIKEEHEYLTSTRRKEIAEHLKEARAFGDLSENAEYDAAKNEQAENEARINELEYTMAHATIISDYEEGVVNLGSQVTVREKKSKNSKTYVILGTTEADPLAGIISNVSPVGQALLGNKVGDSVEVETPGGKRVFEIKKIEKYDASRGKSN